MGARSTVIRYGLICLLGLVVFGCASIIKGSGPQTLSITSEPSGAQVTVLDDRTGSEVSHGTTPFTVALKSSAGYFKGAKYRLRFEKEGCESCELTVQGRASGWYVLGNLVFGGLIGYLIVDPATGAMWTLDQETVNQHLAPKQEAFRRGQGLVVALKSDLAGLPHEVHRNLIYLGTAQPAQ